MVLERKCFSGKAYPCNLSTTANCVIGIESPPTVRRTQFSSFLYLFGNLDYHDAQPSPVLKANSPIIYETNDIQKEF